MIEINIEDHLVNYTPPTPFHPEAVTKRYSRDKDEGEESLETVHMGGPSIVGLSKPLRDDFAVVSSHYNFVGYEAPKRNLRRFIRQMERDGVMVYGTEIFLQGHHPTTTEFPGWVQIQVDEDSIMFQKEALVNATINRLTDNYQMLAEVDADIWFDRPDWPDLTMDMLVDTPVGQPFSQAAWTGREGNIILVRDSATKVGFSTNPWLGHSGFTWAMTRDFFNSTGGFYDKAILGGSDLLWSSVICGTLTPKDSAAGLLDTTESDSSAARHVGLGHRWEHWADHANRIRQSLGSRRPGWISANIWHEYHGSRKKRYYTQRRARLEGFDPATHVELTEDGVLRWTESAPEDLKRRVSEYFALREEDD